MRKATPSRRYFTEAAHAAALAARRTKALIPKGNGVEVFLVRDGDRSKSFSWEIRRFGGVVLVHSEETFPTPAEALAAGRRALVHHVRDRAARTD